MRAALVQHLRARPTPRVEFGSRHETLIIASVATVLVSTQLWLTRSPQLAGRLIWGGCAIGLLLGLPRGAAPPLRPVSAGP